MEDSYLHLNSAIRALNTLIFTLSASARVPVSDAVLFLALCRVNCTTATVSSSLHLPIVRLSFLTVKGFQCSSVSSWCHHFLPLNGNIIHIFNWVPVIWTDHLMLPNVLISQKLCLSPRMSSIVIQIVLHLLYSNTISADLSQIN